MGRRRDTEHETALMTRYFFHICRNGEVVEDREGDEFQTVDDARSSAVKAVRELVAARIKGGQLVADERIEARNDAGELQFAISFHDVVRDHLK